MIDPVVDKRLVLQAIKVLREIISKHYEDSSKKKPLLEEETTSPIFIQVTLKKIPKNKNVKMIRLNLPHTLVKDTTDVCLITGDLDKKNRKAEIEPDKLHYKELLNKNGISEISEIITLRQLRTEYKPYEAKLKLLAAYDVFLADSMILQCLPNILGSHFFKKRKYPIRVDMKAKDLKKEISKALSSKMLYITGRGSSCSTEIAHLDMKNKKIVENVFSFVETLSEKLPGSWDNVLGIYLKTARSKAVPIYVSYGNPSDVNLPVAVEENEFEIDELTTIPNALVKVYKDGSVETVKNSTLHRSKVEEHEVKEIDLELLSQNSIEEVVKPTSEQLNSKQSDSDLMHKGCSKKKTRAEVFLTSTVDTSVNELEICDDSSTMVSKKSKRKSAGQVPKTKSNCSAETSVQINGDLKELNTCDDSSTKMSKKPRRKSAVQVSIAEEDNCSAKTSVPTNSDLKDICNDSSIKKSKKSNRKSAGQVSLAENNYSAETSVQTNSDLKVCNEVEGERKKLNKSKRKRTESEAEFPVFGNLKSKPEFTRSQKKIRLDDSEIKNALERKQKHKNKKIQNKRKSFVKK